MVDCSIAKKVTPNCRLSHGWEVIKKSRRQKQIFWLWLCLSIVFFPQAALSQTHFCHGPPDCATPGTVCPDGTVYAGCAAPNYVPLFVTRCDAGQTYSGSCTGTRTTLPWNNGNTSGWTATVASHNDGYANTVALSTGGTYQDSDSGVGGVQPHQAAQYCTDLTIHGRSDWFLPSASELRTMYLHRTAIANFVSGLIWTSSQSASTNSAAHFIDFTTGSMGNGAKQGSNNIRCARRN